MPISKTVHGTTYTIPESGDTGWAVNTTTILEDLLENDAHLFNVWNYGATGAGAIDEYTYINAAITAASSAGGTVYIPVGNYKIGTNTTFPSNVTVVFDNGAVFTQLASSTLTFNGCLYGPRSQIFSGYSSVDITYGAKVSPIFQEWQGGTAEDEYTIMLKVSRIASAWQTVTANGATTVDFANGYNIKLNLTAAATIGTLSNPRDGERYIFYVYNNGAYNISSWPASVKWRGGAGAPTITSGSGKIDVISMIYHSSDAIYIAEYAQDFS